MRISSCAWARVITAPPYYPAWKIPTVYRSWRFHAETENGVQIKRCPIYVPAVPSGIKRLIHHASFALSSALSIVWQSISWRPDVIFSIAPSLMSAPMAAFMSRRIGATSWLHIQDLEVDAAFDLGLLNSRNLRKFMLSVERRILQSFDRVSTISPQMSRRLISKGVDAENMRELRNWIDLSGIRTGSTQTNLRKEFGFGDSDLIGLYSGTMSNKQGIDLLVETARRLEVSHPNVKFLLSGDGPFKERLKNLASGLTNVTFGEFQPPGRFSELLLTADFHLIPQKTEAADLVLPSKLGGIFASGRPVIVMSQSGTGLAEEVQGAGLVVPPGSTVELAEAIIKLADSPELRAELGKNGRERATTRWDREALLDALADELAKVTNHAEISQTFGRKAVLGRARFLGKI
jgi:colanic acid biosynthesis glycosyl transferase WcaI